MKKIEILAVLGLNNHGGIAITDIDHGINESVRYILINGDDKSEEKNAIIEYDDQLEEYYFMIEDQPYYINEFMKV